MATPFIGGYWSQRKESKAECAHRLSQFIHGVAGLHPLLNRWFKTGWSRKQAVASPIELNEAALTANLQTHNRDTDKQPIPELGFIFDMWNGDWVDAAGIMANCGCYSPYVGNFVTIEIPRIILQQSPLISDSILTLVVRVWEPDRTVVEQLDGTRLEKIWRKPGV